MKKETIKTIAIVALLIIVGAVFIDNITERSYQKGASDSIQYVFNNLAQCKSLPITYGNYTLNAVAQECLK